MLRGYPPASAATHRRAARSRQLPERPHRRRHVGAGLALVELDRVLDLPLLDEQLDLGGAAPELLHVERAGVREQDLDPALELVDARPEFLDLAHRAVTRSRPASTSARKRSRTSLKPGARGTAWPAPGTRSRRPSRREASPSQSRSIASL